jgi:hypothetical protein
MSKMIETKIPNQFERKIQITNKIIEFLLQQKKGVSVNQIWQGLGKSLTRQTIHNHLRDLIAERIVRKKTHAYFLDDLDLYQRHWCGQILSDASSILLKPDRTGTEVYGSEFADRVSEDVPLPSDEFCKTKFGNSSINDYEKFFFDFANRLGSYILYIFLESMRSSQFDNRKMEKGSTKQNLRKKSLSMEFVNKAINLEMFYNIFRERLKELEFDRILLDNSRKKLPDYPDETHARNFNNSEFIEMENDDFKRVWKSYRKIYPTVYDGLKKYWDEATLSVGRDLDVQESLFKIRSKCKHEWNEIKIYKKEGKYYECLRCLNIGNEWMVKKIESKNSDNNWN